MRKLNSIRPGDQERGSEGIKNYANSLRAVGAQKSLLLQWMKNESRVKPRKKRTNAVLKKAPVCAFRCEKYAQEFYVYQKL